jgi:hypothetical protein
MFGYFDKRAERIIDRAVGWKSGRDRRPEQHEICPRAIGFQMFSSNAMAEIFAAVLRPKSVTFGFPHRFSFRALSADAH